MLLYEKFKKSSIFIQINKIVYGHSGDFCNGNFAKEKSKILQFQQRLGKESRNISKTEKIVHF